MTLAAAALVTGVVACSLPTEEPPELQLPTPVVAIPIESLEPTDLQVWEEDPYESEKIEQALVEQGYFRDDVPLSYEDQDFLHTACQESGVPYALALAVIERETQFQNLVGDDGASLGYMQVQERWHWDRMERLGVTDLMNPFGNFRVGCDFLAELLEKYPTQEALTAYNSGSPGYNQYSYDVMANYEKWKELVGDDVSGIKG
ncbi:MAG: lytic transglycosylase domain-containing protein [Oscillibacter sp.]|uniref:lytic transglycosylase domain-containing protein n=1 Tax=Oscillibacter sp. TaxID=1945593 RepID=UPI001D7DAA90|nr:lytic transglycosylase domain-containing protein [Oscillibacter sp.]MBS6290618.1 lytic transglycosylase domain-containing protein [Oscillibacter sp.]